MRFPLSSRTTVFEIVRRVQISVCSQIHLKERTLVLPTAAGNYSMKVRFSPGPGSRLTPFGRLHPDPHSERAPTQNVSFLHATDRGKSAAGARDNHYR
jgi:hypothetical protein